MTITTAAAPARHRHRRSPGARLAGMARRAAEYARAQLAREASDPGRDAVTVALLEADTGVMAAVFAARNGVSVERAERALSEAAFAARMDAEAACAGWTYGPAAGERDGGSR